MKRNKKLLSVILLSVMMLGGCGGILAGVRTGWAVGRPIVDDLVAQQVISADTGAKIKVDIDDGIGSAERGEQCVKNVTGTGTEKKIGKARCYFQVAKDGRAILARHHITGNAKLERYVAIIESVLTALEEYFRNVTGPQDMAGAVDADKELEGKMKAAEAQLKALR